MQEVLYELRCYPDPEAILTTAKVEERNGQSYIVIHGYSVDGIYDASWDATDIHLDMYTKYDNLLEEKRFLDYCREKDQQENDYFNLTR